MEIIKKQIEKKVITSFRTEIEEIEQYKTVDGRIFENREKAEDHEEKLKTFKNLKYFFIKDRKIKEALESICFFGSLDGDPILIKIDMDEAILYNFASYYYSGIDSNDISTIMELYNNEWVLLWNSYTGDYMSFDFCSLKDIIKDAEEILKQINNILEEISRMD